MSCQISPNTTVAGDLQYWRWNESIQHIVDCGATYIRPDNGCSLQPWLLVVFQIIIHSPAVLVRMARWERVQIFSLALASVNIAIYIQAYVSTGLTAHQVLVWTPLTLILDAGSLLQVLVLIIEGIGLRTFLRTLGKMAVLPFTEIWERARHLGPTELDSTESTTVEMARTTAQHASVGNVDAGESTPSYGGASDGYTRSGSADARAEEDLISKAGQSSRLLEAKIDLESRKRTGARDGKKKVPYGRTFIAFLALLLLIAVVNIQLIALAAAVRGRRIPDLHTNWCSPMFIPFVVAVLNGDCQFHEISGRQHWGNGCISLPAQQQSDWLVGTTVLLSLSLAFQLFDFCILTLVNDKERWQEVKMKRPWLTMFGGILVLILITAYGTFYSSRIPVGVTDLVWLFHWEGAGSFMTVCTTELHSSGLRGASISWIDGIFDSWGQTYYGSGL